MNEKPLWKERFPVSWTEDAYVNRRDFTRTLGMVSFAAFVTTGALAIFGRLHLTRRSVAFESRRLDEARGLAVGDSRVFYYPNEHDPCRLLRRSVNDYVAFAQRCTHLGCPVVYRQEKERLYCPCHEGFFDAADGLPLAGPPRRRLKRIVLERRGLDWWATGVVA